MWYAKCQPKQNRMCDNNIWHIKTKTTIIPVPITYTYIYIYIYIYRFETTYVNQIFTNTDFVVTSDCPKIYYKWAHDIIPKTPKSTTAVLPFFFRLKRNCVKILLHRVAIVNLGTKLPRYASNGILNGSNTETDCSGRYEKLLFGWSGL